MKKNLFLALMLAVAVAGCKKSSDDDSNNGGGGGGGGVSAVPATFTQKVMVEELTGQWCGWCVLGAEGIKKAEIAHPNKVNSVALHGGGSDPMEVPEYDDMVSFGSVSGVPHYKLNRGTGGGFPGSFSSQITTAVSQVADCGLAIDARASSGNAISVTVHAGFNKTITDDLRLVAYLVEDTIKNASSSYSQANFVSGNSSYQTSEYYSLPSTIPNYTHKHVARKLLSASMEEGDPIPSASAAAGKSYVKTYTYTVPTGSGWNTSNLSVVVGILKYNATCAQQKFLNSQTGQVGKLTDWD